jgi:hypothetical protein
MTIVKVNETITTTTKQSVLLSELELLEILCAHFKLDRKLTTIDFDIRQGSFVNSISLTCEHTIMRMPNAEAKDS